MGFEDGEVDEGKSAKFNAGVLQTQRLSRIMDNLNFSKTNPEAFNSDYCEWNYNLWMKNINNLYDEIDANAKPKERVVCLKIKQKIEELMEKYPIRETKRKIKSKSEETNKDNLRIIRKAMEIYEREVKKLGIKYQITSATRDVDLEGL